MTSDGARELWSVHANTLATMRVDAVTVEVVTALHGIGIDPILLKGRTIARWLYDNADPRAYGDTDLLIRAGELARAESLLATLGFEPDRDPNWIRDWPAPGRPWLRQTDEAMVDVHRSLAGVEVDDDALWTALSDELESMNLAGVDVTVLSPAARVCHIALHVAQHEARTTQPLIDLQRALDRVDRATWVRAAGVAERLGAIPAFALGLAALPEGEQLGRELGLPSPGQAALTADANRLDRSLEALAHAPGTRARASMVINKLFPSRRFMQGFSPLASRGRLGLTITYMWRPLWLFGRALNGIRGWHSRRV